MVETIYYLETADGGVMRVPESKLGEFQAINKRLKEKQEQNAKAQQRKFLTKDLPKKR